MNGFFPGLARIVSEEGLPDAAVEELTASGAWAKVIGDFFDDNGRPRANWRPNALVETARRVHAAGGRVAIHAILPDVIHAAIEAGFDSIEHAIMLQEDHIPLLVRRKTALVPTLIIGPGVLDMLVEMGAPTATIRMIEQVVKNQPEMVRRAADAGVVVLAGTDAGMGPHGEIATEVQYLLGAGLAPDVALGAASWTARAFLALSGIEELGLADIVAYDDDPRQDPEVLRRPVLMTLNGEMVEPSGSYP